MDRRGCTMGQHQGAKGKSPLRIPVQKPVCDPFAHTPCFRSTAELRRQPVGIGHHPAEQGADGRQSCLDRGRAGNDFLDRSDEAPYLAGVTDKLVSHVSSHSLRFSFFSCPLYQYSFLIFQYQRSRVQTLVASIVLSLTVLTQTIVPCVGLCVSVWKRIAAPST